jgi:GH24 family phage-related lysozyme (muramidase)
MNDQYNRDLITRHEGRRLRVYPDSRGYPTVGIGFNLAAPEAPSVCAAVGADFDAVRTGRALTNAQCDAIFDRQYGQTARAARSFFPGIDNWPEAAAAVVCDMIFQLGKAGFSSFENAIARFRAGDWAGAAREIQDSKLARQTPGRVAENVALLNGVS